MKRKQRREHRGEASAVADFAVMFLVEMAWDSSRQGSRPLAGGRGEAAHPRKTEHVDPDPDGVTAAAPPARATL